MPLVAEGPLGQGGFVADHQRTDCRMVTHVRVAARGPRHARGPTRPISESAQLRRSTFKVRETFARQSAGPCWFWRAAREAGRTARSPSDALGQRKGQNRGCHSMRRSRQLADEARTAGMSKRGKRRGFTIGETSSSPG